MKRFLAAVSILVLGACGIPLDEAPRVLDIAIETDIVDPGAGSGELPAIADVYFVTGDRLVSVSRQLADADPATVLLALIRGPIAAENALSIRSAIPPETEVLGVSVVDAVATVDLTRDFTLIGGEEEILAIAQIVATLAALDGVDGVRLAIEGTPRQAPVSEGQLVDRPLLPTDFADLFTR